MPRIALIGLSELESQGLLNILRESAERGDGKEAIINRFSSLKDFRQEAEKNDAFVVSAESFMMNIDFFIPRRARTVVVTQCNQNVCTISAEANTGGVKMIHRDSTYQEVLNILDILSNVSERNPEISGELSIRETDVLRELASGKTNKEIADKLSISVNTVITHRKNISTKLGIKSVSGLSLYALMNGLI